MSESMSSLIVLVIVAIWMKTGDYGMTWRDIAKYLFVSSFLYLAMIFVRANWSGRELSQRLPDPAAKPTGACH